MDEDDYKSHSLELKNTGLVLECNEGCIAVQRRLHCCAILIGSHGKVDKRGMVLSKLAFSEKLI